MCKNYLFLIAESVNFVCEGAWVCVWGYGCVCDWVGVGVFVCGLLDMGVCVFVRMYGGRICVCIWVRGYTVSH